MLIDGIRLGDVQREAESLMVDTCVVQRVDVNSVVTDPLTGLDSSTSAPVYSGKCRVRSRQSAPRDVDSADSTAVVQQFELHVPVTAGPFQVGDVVQARGYTFRVSSLHIATFLTAQRLPVDVVI